MTGDEADPSTQVAAGSTAVLLYTGHFSFPQGHFIVYVNDGTTVKPVFRVDSDGTIHGLASVGAITWDL